MTSPVVGAYPDGTLEEGDLPDKSANYDSLADFAAKTEEDWDTELRGAEDYRWGAGGFLGGMFLGLSEGKPFLVALVEAIANAIFSGAQWVFTTINEALENLAQWFQDRWNALTGNTSQATVTANTILATNVSGGVAVSDKFDRASANDLGSSWTQTSSDGAGAGYFGTNGSGRAVWKKSGGSTRRHVNRFNTPVATDYQAIQCVIGKIAEASSGGGTAYNYLLGRMDSAGDNAVYLRISRTQIAVGKLSSGSWFSPWSTASISATDGDQWTFYLGTSTDDRQFIVKQNGVTKLTHTDTSGSSLGASYRYAGLAALAADRSSYTDQTRPGELDVWSAADRLSTTT